MPRGKNGVFDEQTSSKVKKASKLWEEVKEVSVLDTKSLFPIVRMGPPDGHMEVLAGRYSVNLQPSKTEDRLKKGAAQTQPNSTGLNSRLGQPHTRPSNLR